MGLREGTITLEMLEMKEPCRSYITRFKEDFPRGEAEITTENCLKYAKRYNFFWATSAFLPEQCEAKFRLLYEAMSMIGSLAFDLHREVQAAAFAILWRETRDNLLYGDDLLVLGFEAKWNRDLERWRETSRNIETLDEPVEIEDEPQGCTQQS